MTNVETLNLYYYSWIYMTEMSDKWAKHFMQLSLFSQHITFKCVKVVNSKRGRKQNQMSFQYKQAALDGRECSCWSVSSIFSLKLKLNFILIGCITHVNCVLG